MRAFLRMISTLDLFGQPFFFRTDPSVDQKSLAKKTPFGSLVSIGFMIISVLYLIFLLYEFFAGLVPPVVSEILINQGTAITENFDTTPITVNIRFPIDLKGRDANEYFSVFMVNTGALSNKTQQLSDSQPIQVGLQIEYSYPIVEKFALISDPADKQNNQKLAIVIQKCQPGNSLGVTCKSDTDIETLLQDDDCEIDILLHFQEMNFHKGQLENKHVDLFSAIDPSTVQALQLQLFIGTVETDTGFLISKRNIQKYVSGFDKHSEYFTSDYAEKRWGADNPVFKDSLKVINLHLARQSSEFIVVYEKFPQVLAKFMAFFNSILALGILAKMGSEAKLFEMLMDNYVICYYKKSAAAILEGNTKRGLYLSKSKSKVDVEDKRKRFSSVLPEKYSELFAFPTLKSTIYHNKGPKEYEKFKEQQQKKREGDYKENDTNESNSLKNLPTVEQQEKIYYSQYARIAEQMDFRTLYKEVYSVKAALQMLFTPEQYAAIQYVGREICLEDQESILKNDDKKNHLEKIDLVEENEEYRNRKLLDYLNTMPSKSTDLDKKIQDCLIPQLLKVFNRENNNDEQDIQKTEEGGDDIKSPQNNNNTVQVDQQKSSRMSDNQEKQELVKGTEDSENN